MHVWWFNWYTASLFHHLTAFVNGNMQLESAEKLESAHSLKSHWTDFNALYIFPNLTYKSPCNRKNVMESKFLMQHLREHCENTEACECPHTEYKTPSETRSVYWQKVFSYRMSKWCVRAIQILNQLTHAILKKRKKKKKWN